MFYYKQANLFIINAYVFTSVSHQQVVNKLYDHWKIA